MSQSIQPPSDEDRRLARSQWPVATGRLAAMEQDAVDLSATTTVEERFAIVWQLTQDAWAMRGETIEPGLLRSVARVIRRGS